MSKLKSNFKPLFKFRKRGLARGSFERVSDCARWLLLCLLTIPVLAGVVGVFLPAMGYFPAIGANQFDFRVFAALFDVAGIHNMMWLSLFTGVVATVIAALFAFVLLSVFYRSKVLSRLQIVLSPFLVLPHAGAAIALVFLLSPSGFFVRLFTFDTNAIASANESVLLFDSFGMSIIVALVLKEIPFILLMALSVMSQPLIQEKINGYFKVGSALGYSSIAIFFKLVLPMVFPQIRLPLLAVLVFAVSNVEIPLILGANDPSTLAVAILHWFNHIDLSMRLQASSAAVVLVGIAVFAVIVLLIVEKGICLTGKAWLQRGKRQVADKSISAAAYLLMAVYMVLGVSAVYTLVAFSFAKQWTFPSIVPAGLTMLHWSTVFDAVVTPLSNTLLLGVSVSFSALVLVLLTLESKPLKVGETWASLLLPTALFLPLLVPGVAFLYGLVWFQQLFLKDAVWFHVYVAHMVYVIPYVYLSLAVAYGKFDNRYVMVALSLGTSPMNVFFLVKLPLLIGPILVAFALGLAISFSQYLPTLLTTGGAISTVTTEAVALAAGSSARLSAAYVVIQAVMPLCGFGLAWWLSNILFKPSKNIISTNKSNTGKSVKSV
ncbi:ABC transporter permease [Alteromonas sp. A081]|uniref:ABC transporter permease n=1 Tax=Alteromonas sp. A081 TaxID=3410269 RepID=UPI003B984DE9